MIHEKLIDKNSNTLISVPNYLKKHFLDLGYPKVPKVFLIDVLYIFYYTKVKRIISFYFKLFFRSKINFDFPEEKKFLIFDKMNSEYLEYLFLNKNYFILKSRLEHIDEIYLNKEIILFCIKNFFKRSIRLNYLLIIVKLVNPKIILTMIDNSTDFYIISNFFKKSGIKTFAIQNANRMVDLPVVYENRFVHNYYIIGDYEKKVFKKRDETIVNLESIGSLKATLAKAKFNKNTELKKDYYDLCVVCDPYFFTNDKELINMNYDLIVENIYKVAEYALKYSKKFNKKIVLSGKYEPTSHLKKAEEIFYKNYIKDHNFEISFNTRKNFGNYANLYESKIIVGYSSTMLREAFAFDKKVLCLDYANIQNIEFPSDGICLLKEKKYDLFEKRIELIEKLSYEDYLNQVYDLRSIYRLNINTVKFLKGKLELN